MNSPSKIKKSKKREVAEDAPKKSKGQIFKEQHGISRTLANNVRRKLNIPRSRGITPEDVLAYKTIRKARKLEERKEKQKKHAASVLHMRTKGKVRKSRKKKAQVVKPAATTVTPQ